jgi:hypothetical protein
MPDSNDKPKNLGPTSLGMDIIEIGGEEDTRVRPLRKVLRDQLEQAAKAPKQQAPPSKEDGATNPKQEPHILVPDHAGGDIATVLMGGEEDTRVRPLRESLRKHIKRDEKQQAEKREKENGETGAP